MIWFCCTKIPFPFFNFYVILFNIFARGSVVVKALCYKPEGRGFDTLWGEEILSIYLILPAALGPGVYSAHSTKFSFSNENTEPVFIRSFERSRALINDEHAI
jgi:hypothetical protein